MISRQKRKYLQWSAFGLFLVNGLFSASLYFDHSASVDSAADQPETKYASIAMVHEKGKGHVSKADGHGMEQVALKDDHQQGAEVAREPGMIPEHSAVSQAHPPGAATQVERRAPAVQMEDKLICYEVGPFESSGQSKALRKSLKKSGLNVALEFRSRQTELGYWVYLPPERSLALGRLKEEELKSKGLKDVMLVAKSDPKYAISLGVFHQKETAEQRLTEVQSMGYEPKMEIRQQNDNEAWLNVKTKESQDLPPQEWLALLEGLERVELKTVACK